MITMQMNLDGLSIFLKEMLINCVKSRIHMVMSLSAPGLNKHCEAAALLVIISSTIQFRLHHVGKEEIEIYKYVCLLLYISYFTLIYFNTL